MLAKLGLTDDDAAPEIAENVDAHLAERVSAELGSDWARTVAPAFDAEKIVLVDDRWATSREDLVRIWLTSDADLADRHDTIVESFAGAGQTVAQHATWWQGKALAAGEATRAQIFGAIAAAAQAPDAGEWSDEIAVVTGAGKGSIAAGVIGRLLAGLSLIHI